MRDLLGDGYVEALRKAWKGDVPDSADFVMFWWRKAAELVREGKAKRFGLITTNSIHQTFNRRVIEPFLADAKKTLHLAYAIPDHPWIDSADGAAVRIAMTVAAPGKATGQLEKVITEQAHADGENEVTLSTSEGSLASNLQIGADTASCVQLASNDNLSNNGVILGGKAFEVDYATALSLGMESNPEASKHLRRYLGGSSLTSRFEESYVIDLFGLCEKEIQVSLPEIYQWVYTRIRDKRLQNKRKTRRENWWLFNESVPKLRRMLDGLPRFIGTTETAKHRMFSFIDGAVLPDHMVISVAVPDAFVLGVLSSKIHVVWALANGGTLEDRPRYNKSRCFETFPFPALEEGALKQRIRDLGERLDAHRKRQQALHPDLTLTGMYNVLEKLRAGEALTAKERVTHDQGLVSVLKQIHDDLDAAVLEAYGWVADLEGPFPLADRLAENNAHAEAIQQEILTRLVALNHERAAEEKRGLIRYLRPDYQAPGTATTASHQPEIGLTGEDDDTTTETAPTAQLDWPAELPAQVAAVRKLLPTTGPDAETLSACFGRKNKKRSDQITAILATLRALGHLA